VDVFKPALELQEWGFNEPVTDHADDNGNAKGEACLQDHHLPKACVERKPASPEFFQVDPTVQLLFFQQQVRYQEAA
jgi:hypothetical protein